MALMANLTLIGIGIAGLVGASFSKLLADEAAAWLPVSTDWLRKRAVNKLLRDRDRYCEEWASFLDAVPGKLWRFALAADLCLRAAPKMRQDQRKQITRQTTTLLELVESAVCKDELTKVGTKAAVLRCSLQAPMVRQCCDIQGVAYGEEFSRLSSLLDYIERYTVLRFETYRNIEGELRLILRNVADKQTEARFERVAELLGKMTESTAELPEATKGVAESATKIVDAYVSTVEMVKLSEPQRQAAVAELRARRADLRQIT